MPEKPEPKVTVNTSHKADSGKVVRVETVLGVELVEFVEHALLQMRIRSITEEEVLQTLRRPHSTGLRADQGRERYRRNKNARIAIDVVFEKLPDRLRVITAISKARRLSGR